VTESHGDELLIRSASAADLAALTDLYNHYVTRTAVTFDLKPLSPERRREWLSHYSDKGPYRLLVAERDGSVCGYATSSRFRPKAAYDTSVETTVYLAPGSWGRGIGSALYVALFASLATEDVHRAYAGITLPNPASIALHRRFGFAELALFDEVGRKFGHYWSVQWFEKRMD
jgi:phosphinothricin acetyltransferase